MEDDILIGRKRDIVHIMKHVLIGVLLLLAIRYILGDALFLYAKQYIYKEETNIIYEMDQTTLYQRIDTWCIAEDSL